MSVDTFEQDAGPDIGQIIAIGKRRFLFFLIPATLTIIVTVAAAFLLPPRYESSATVLIESQQIPVELIQSTVTSDPNQRITIIKQRVMTRKNLLQIIDKYDVFKEDRKRLSVTKLIEQMQKLVGVDVITASGRLGESTIAFKLSFQHESPEIATKVANELVTLFLSENVKTRTSRAAETTEFLQQQALKLREELVLTETAISKYKKEHQENLPEHLNLHLSILNRTQEELKSLEQQISSLREERRYLNVELVSAQTFASSTNDKGARELSASEKELETLQDLLTESSVRLTDAHPDIKSLKRRIILVENKVLAAKAARLGEESGKETATVEDRRSNAATERLKIRISANESTIQKFQQELKQLREKILNIERLILKTPEVERGLIELTRNQKEISEKYAELETKQGKAQLAQNLEEEKKAERFTLLEPPILPSEPVWPDRLKIIAIGCFLALGSGIGTAFLVELVDKRVRTAAELEALLKHPPLVSIPYIKTQRDIQKKRYKVGMALIFPTLLAGGALVAIHRFYKPLDVLFYKAWVFFEKLNIMPF